MTWYSMQLFRRKRQAVEIQQTAQESQPLRDDLQIPDMPPGTKFRYLGRDCVVIDYAPEWAGEHLGVFGMTFHYADDRGRLCQGNILPRNYAAFRSAVEIIGAKT